MNPDPFPAPTVRRSSPPPAVIAAVLLMVPAAVTWLVAGVAFVVAIARGGRGDAMFLVWIIAMGILGICLLMVLLTVTGIRHAWRGRSNLLTKPAGVTVALFVVALVNLLIRKRLTYHPTMLTPLVVGSLALVALALLRSKPAKAWLTRDLH